MPFFNTNTPWMDKTYQKPRNYDYRYQPTSQYTGRPMGPDSMSPNYNTGMNLSGTGVPDGNTAGIPFDPNAQPQGSGGWYPGKALRNAQANRQARAAQRPGYDPNSEETALQQWFGNTQDRQQEARDKYGFQSYWDELMKGSSLASGEFNPFDEMLNTTSGVNSALYNADGSLKQGPSDALYGEGSAYTAYNPQDIQSQINSILGTDWGVQGIGEGANKSAVGDYYSGTEQGALDTLSKIQGQDLGSLGSDISSFMDNLGINKAQLGGATQKALSDALTGASLSPDSEKYKIVTDLQKQLFDDISQGIKEDAAKNRGLRSGRTDQLMAEAAAQSTNEALNKLMEQENQLALQAPGYETAMYGQDINKGSIGANLAAQLMGAQSGAAGQQLQHTLGAGNLKNEQDLASLANEQFQYQTQKDMLDAMSAERMFGQQMEQQDRFGAIDRALTSAGLDQNAIQQIMKQLAEDKSLETLTATSPEARLGANANALAQLLGTGYNYWQNMK